MAGLFSEKVEVCIKQVAKSATGSNIAGSETVVATIYLDIKEKGLKRTDESGKLVFNTVYEFEMWKGVGIELTTSHYLKYRGKKLIIQSITEVPNQMKIKVVCEGI